MEAGKLKHSSEATMRQARLSIVRPGHPCRLIRFLRLTGQRGCSGAPMS